MRVVLLCLCLCVCPLFAQSENVTLRSHMNLNEMSLNPNSGSDIWGFTDPAGREYAIMTVNNGTVVVDITNPDAIVEVGAVPGNSSSWRDAKTYIYDNTPGNFTAYAFVTTEASQGLQIIDLSDVPNSISLAATFNGFSSAHNIYIHPEADEPYAYILGSNLANGGVLVLDISDPLNPVQVGTWSNFYVHDFYLFDHWADPAYDGRDVGIAFCGSNNMSLIDFSDKTNPVLIEDYVYPNLSYCHAGWVSEDGRYVYINDEFDEGQLGRNTTIYVVDLLDMTVPTLANTWVGPTPATDHNCFVKDNYLHMSNYRRGYTLLDISTPSAPEHVGFYDTYPANNNSPTSGAWGVYPWYDSGVVAVSDISTGLYIMEPQIGPSFWVQAGTTALNLCAGASDDIVLTTGANSQFSGTIALSAEGVPAGLGVSFSVNPVTPGGSSTVTVDSTGVAAGSYTFTLRGTGTGAGDRTITVRLEIQAGADAAPVPTLPANGETCAGGSFVTLGWDSLGPGRSYQVQVATDAAFSNLILDTTTTDTTAVVDGPLVPDTLHYWRVRGENACGFSPYGPVFQFISGAKPVLLVDDDTGSVNALPYYTGLLDTMGLPYEVFDTLSGDGPSAAQMGAYQWVIWFSGESTSNAGPTDNDELQLAAYLDAGGRLFLSSQDYYYTQGALTSFMQDYLKVSSVDSDNGNYTSVNGINDLAAIGNMSLNPYLGTDYSDTVNPDVGGVSVMRGNNDKSAAVQTANTFFAGFVFASVINNDPARAQAVLTHFYDSYGITECGVAPSACVLFDMEGDGFDLDDFKARAAAWGGDADLASLINLVGCLPQ